jgi:hypothetical protein
MPTESTPIIGDKPKQKTEKITAADVGGLTYKQQLRKDALLWAEFMYSEYKRVKEQREDAQSKPTYHDNTDV